jgi:hypothetical protein
MQPCVACNTFIWCVPIAAACLSPFVRRRLGEKSNAESFWNATCSLTWGHSWPASETSSSLTSAQCSRGVASDDLPIRLWHSTHPAHRRNRPCPRGGWPLGACLRSRGVGGCSRNIRMRRVSHRRGKTQGAHAAGSAADGRGRRVKRPTAPGGGTLPALSGEAGLSDEHARHGRLRDMPQG